MSGSATPLWYTSRMKTFRDKVYEVTAKIPKGKVATYGQIARLAGKPKAARAVGGFMRTNDDPKHIPCHRVVGANGALVGYAFKGVSEKRKKLIDEGVSMDGANVNLAVSLWKQ
jgi:methylated-DNA-protein-cysteine methyltransferase related protein